MKSKEVDIAKTVELLKGCDKVRDEYLPQLGILLEDRDDGESVVKFKSMYGYLVCNITNRRDEQLKENERKEELKQQRLQQEVSTNRMK